MIIKWLKSWVKKSEPKPAHQLQLDELQELFNKYTNKGCESEIHCKSCSNIDEIYLSSEIKKKMREDMIRALNKVNTEMNILLKSGDDIAISEAQVIINNVVKDFKVQKLTSNNIR